MNVIINGVCGRMGQAMVRLIEQRQEVQLASGVDVRADGEPYLTDLRQAKPADVIIDFSFHTAVSDLLQYACQQFLPVVICTTGHTEAELEQIRQAAKKIPVFHSGNMSLGIAALRAMAKKAAALFPDADIEIIETHHKHKQDAPSGTALMLAESIRQARQGAELTFGRHGIQPREPGEIGIHAVRRGEIVGIHEVQISTGAQTLTLKHEAHSREVFAEGALSAAEFLLHQPAGLYDMDDLTR